MKSLEVRHLPPVSRVTQSDHIPEKILVLITNPESTIEDVLDIVWTVRSKTLTLFHRADEVGEAGINL